jgi:hypothetical protein
MEMFNTPPPPSGPPRIEDIPPELLGNMIPQKCNATPEEEKAHRPMMEKLADWCRKNPRTVGHPEFIKGGGPGDSDAISCFLASSFYAAGLKVRLVLALGAPKAQGIFVEVFHPKFGKDGAWIVVLPYAQWIFETADILKSRRVLEQKL